MRSWAEVATKPTGRVLLSADTIRGSFTALSWRAVRDVRVRVTRSMEGRRVGRVTIGGRSHRLVMPRRGLRLLADRGSVALSRRPTVVLRAIPAGGLSRDRVVLSIREFSRGSRLFELRFDGAGLGLLITPRGCPASPRMRLYALRAGAAPAAQVTGFSC